MTSTRLAGEILDRDFLAIRHAILNIAAGLDRVGDGRAVDSVAGDPRLERIHEALKVLAEGETGRAERVQMLFSRAYESNWRS